MKIILPIIILPLLFFFSGCATRRELEKRDSEQRSMIYEMRISNARMLGRIEDRQQRDENRIDAVEKHLRKSPVRQDLSGF